MATWFDLPKEVRLDIFRIIFDDTEFHYDEETDIFCHIREFDDPENEDELSFRLVSKQFATKAELSLVILETAHMHLPWYIDNWCTGPPPYQEYFGYVKFLAFDNDGSSWESRNLSAMDLKATCPRLEAIKITDGERYPWTRIGINGFHDQPHLSAPFPGLGIAKESVVFHQPRRPGTQPRKLEKLENLENIAYQLCTYPREKNGVPESKHTLMLLIQQSEKYGFTVNINFKASLRVWNEPVQRWDGYEFPARFCTSDWSLRCESHWPRKQEVVIPQQKWWETEDTK